MLSNKETLSEKFIKKWFWLYFFTFLAGPLWYFVKVLISRDLSIEEVGIIYWVISFISLLAAYGDLGFTESLSYYLPKYIVKNDYARWKYILKIVLSSQIICSLTIYLLIFVWAPWLSKYYFKNDIVEILQIAWLFFIGSNLLHFAKSLFLSAQDTKLQNGSEFFRLVVTAIGVSILFFSDLGNTKFYMMAWINWLLFGVLFWGFWAIKKYYIPYFHGVKSHKDVALRKEFILYSLSTLFAGNVAIILSQIDMQLIIYLLSSADVWYYSTYLSIMGIPFMLFWPIIWFLLPIISELSWRGNDAKITFLVQKFWNYFLIISIWTSAFLYIFGKNITIFLFGDKFTLSWEILEYSVPFLVFNVLSQISFQALSWRWEIKKRIEVLIYCLICNVWLNVIFIELYGVKWSALAVWLSWILLFILAVKATRIPFVVENWKRLFSNIFLLFITIAISYLFTKKIHLHLEYEILFAILLYVSIFLLTNIQILKDFIALVKQSRVKNI
jgi:O-antigen/teichoic acid export membrane protein